MARTKSALSISLPPPYLEALDIFARSLGVKPVAGAAALLCEALVPFLPKGAADQAAAEQELMRFVRGLVDEQLLSKTWDEHVTGNIFRRIKAEMLSTYERAVSTGQSGRIHRAIGRFTKRRLGAESGGLCPPGDLSDIITGYTLLIERAVEDDPLA